jgi:putative PIG3 family NAD(P)H quinone oxidoreductase
VNVAHWSDGQHRIGGDLGSDGDREKKYMTTMRAIEISKPGGPDVLTPTTRPVPQAGYGQVVIRLAFAGVNRPDALQRAGAYDPPKGASDLPGLEGAGEITAVGPGVTQWQVGDLVCALLPGGGYAEYVATSAAHCLPIPAGLDLKQAACLPETYFTVWTNVFMRGGLTAGERFLVHGGSSGIGTTAIQLANAFGARVFATAGSDAKCQACLDLGAETAINYRESDFSDILRAEGGANLILDMVGGDYLPRNVRALADDGRLVQIAFLQGPKVELNFAQVMMRRLTITGSTLRPQSDAAKGKIAAALQAKVWPLLASGRVAPVMDSEFALKDAAQAHARMESSGHIGKIVLRIN